MANSSIAVSQGSGKNLATYSLSEDATNKEVQRASLNTSSGTEVGTSGAPLRVDPTGTTTQPVSASSLPLPTGASTSAAQTDGSQKTQIVDGSGNVIGATSNALDINIKSGSVSVDTTGLATTTTDTNTGTIAGDTTSIDAKIPALGQALAAASVPVVLTAAQLTTLTPPAAITGFSTENTLSAINTKLVTGTDIGDVTINNASGASAVNIQDGGNTITVDGTVSANATLSAETTKKIGVVAIDQSNPGVTNSVILGSETTKVIGTVNIAAAQTLATVTTVGAVTGITNALPAGTNAIGKLAANSGVDIGDVDVTSIAAGTNAIGNVGLIPRTTGGLTTYHLVSAGSTNAANIKASAGQVFGWYIYNSNAAARKVVFHNTAGTPTAGASVYFSLMIPPASGANVFSDIGIPFSTGIAITTVTGLADSDSAAVTANDLIINIWYS